jgi:hypothetical protein
MSDPMRRLTTAERREFETHLVRQLHTLRVRLLRTSKITAAFWVRPDECVEIRSGAIISDPVRPGLYCLDTNTAQGLRRFEGREIPVTDAQSEMQSQEWGYKQPLGTPIAWSFLLPWNADDDEAREIVPFAERTRATHQLTQTPSVGVSQDDIESSPGEFLTRLRGESLNHQDRRRLIVEVEVIDFESEQLGSLHSVLRDFIAKYRESNDPDDLVAVGSAIRKCVATLQADEALAYAAQLLEAGPRTPVPLEVELELAKMIVRKLTANPLEPSDSLPELGDRLLEIAKTYLNPRLLAREKYRAIALNATLGLVLLRSRHGPEVFRSVAELNVPWFRQLLARRVRRLQHELKGRSLSESLEGLVSSLAEGEIQPL